MNTGRPPGKPTRQKPAKKQETTASLSDAKGVIARNGPEDLPPVPGQILQELKEEVEKYRTIADNTADMERYVLADSTLVYVSPSCEAVTGYLQEEFYQDPGLQYRIVHPDDQSTYRLMWTESLASGSPLHGLVLRIVRKDGEVRWMDIRIKSIFGGDGTLAGFRSSTRDITGEVKTRELLQLSEARMKAVTDSQTELIVRHLADSTILYVNQSFCRFIGAGEEQLAGRKWFDLVDAEIDARIQSAMKQITFDNPTVSLELPSRRQDGVWRWVSWRSTGIFDASGSLMEFQVVGRDITARKETEEKLGKTLEEVHQLKQKLEEENQYLREKVTQPVQISGMVTGSPKMQQVLTMVQHVAATDSPVLLFGETGTGKEVIANAIHNGSPRSKRLMITVNCAALPPSLIESELFGREKGAYTGALTRQIGRFEMAHGSTIFLDEIGELPPEIQVKLLRVLQTGEFQLLGSPLTRKVDVRVIAATNRDLQRSMDEGSFRRDLFYRLNVFPITLPPLRERKEDIPLLTWSFVDEITGKMGKRIEKISAQSMNTLVGYSWPGNIRELRNVVEYSIILSHGPVLDIILKEQREEVQKPERLNDEQRRHILKILELTGWRIRGKFGAAERLGLKESTLRFRMKKLGITREGNLRSGGVNRSGQT